MELANGKIDVVDPEVRAYVSSLVTALGGSGADEDGRYILGDDALACLRDLKRWLKLYDEKANRLDVARCLAESNLVGGDLLQILAAWPENATDDKFKSKIALACLELLVPLTWPLDTNNQQMTVNHHRHIPYLQLAQLGYKRSIVNFDNAPILHTAVRCALPSMAEAMSERSTRDEGIIKLVLYFLRNIAMIAPPPNVQFEGDETEISRSATIDAFQYQDIMHVILTVSSTMGEEFNTQDVVVMDLMFHLIKGVDIEKLFLSDTDADNSKMENLVRLRQKEAAMLRSYQVNAPTRHNRFGTMVWLQRENAKRTTISGQTALTDATRGLAKMDSAKKFKPPRRALKGDSGPLDFDTPAALTAPATKALRSFVEEFLDSGFNPLFKNIRKAIDREAERVLGYHPRQFFYLISWFLEAERRRRKSKITSKTSATEDLDSFAIVAEVLNQEMFVTLNRAMDSAFENKNWNDLSASMKCFTQILLTVQEMSESPLEEDQEIAENILNRIFYEETTHDRVANITRTYNDQGFGYLDSCTDLAHNYLRILEQYSKQNVDLQVKSRRRVRRKKKAVKETGDENGEDNGVDPSDDEDEARAEKTSNERKFDFKRFAARFVTQGCVDTFVSFAAYYSDLRPAQLKRCHRFFYRVAFKQEMSVMLFRVDIICLLYKMIKGPEGLDPQMSTYKEWDELVKQVLKRCNRKIEERPELVVEMLFSKINSTAHFLEYGYEKQTVTSKPRAPVELEVKPGNEWMQQVGIVVSAMLDRNEGEYLQWVKTQLSAAESQRRSWEGANIALHSIERDPFAEEVVTQAPTQQPPAAPIIAAKTESDAQKRAIFKNGHLRLLMTLVGLQRDGADDDVEALWIVPSTLSADQLLQALDMIKKFEFSPPVFEDGQEAGDFIRRKSAGTANRKRAAFDDDDDDDGDIVSDIGEELFPAGGPTAMRKSDALAALKKSRRSRRKEGSDEEDNGLSEEVLKARAEARRQKELEKSRKIRSELFVHDSDDETDEERDRIFFEQEEKLRQRTNLTAVKELLGSGKSKEKPAPQNIRQRQLDVVSDTSDNGDDVQSRSRKRQSNASSVDTDEDNAPVVRSRKRQSSAISANSDGEDDASTSPPSRVKSREDILAESDDQATDTPLSSSPFRSSAPKRRKTFLNSEVTSSPVGPEESVKDVARIQDEGENEEGNILIMRPARSRVRAGFVVDSSDEE